MVYNNSSFIPWGKNFHVLKESEWHHFHILEIFLSTLIWQETENNMFICLLVSQIFNSTD